MSDHPETEFLQNYLNNIAATEFKDLRLHLARCSQCRAVVDGLTGLQHLSQHSPAEKEALTEQQHQQIADYMDGNLNASDQQQLTDFIQSNAAAMKAALFYASHKSAMDKAALKSKSATHFQNRTVWQYNHLLDEWLNKFKSLVSLQAPVWLTIPATAALVAFISINIINPPVTENSLYTIAGYQDNAIIQFKTKNALPGIGFFVNSSPMAEPYGTVSVSVTDNNHIAITWLPVSDALNYKLRLHVFNQGTKTVIGEITTHNTSADISTGLDNIYHRYEWVLSGETQDNRVFTASGGFVINKPDKGVSR